MIEVNLTKNAHCCTKPLENSIKSNQLVVSEDHRHVGFSQAQIYNQIAEELIFDHV